MDRLKLTDIIKKLYGDDESILDYQTDRYLKLIETYKEKILRGISFGEDSEYHLFSTPGRTEIGGNHTDHNNGRVLAGSINLDSIAVVSKNNNNKVTLYSEGYENPFVVDLNSLAPIKAEEGDTNSLIRGIAARFVELGYKIGGFNGVIASDVLRGSGLSSSASIEVLIGTIFNAFYNSDSVPVEEIAKISQYVENVYFGKPCGLMDQMACAVGGIITINFKDKDNPIVEKVNFDFDATGYNLIVVDTGGNHADLTDDYASVPSEMKSVANYFNKSFCSEIDYNLLIENIPDIRSKLGDRAVLRAIHFLSENERVIKQVEALRNNDFDRFLNLIKSSGDSSFKWLQNIYPTSNIKEQGVTLALSVTEKFIEENGKGACRVHGGGFAGTIQVFIPSILVEKYKKLIDSIFGTKSVSILKIRDVGTTCLSL
ncbi:MAG: hypothetical protein L3J41_15690 [Melioribacteraceae bacterium]|nr:hypothetical protein [Melioribacteraceae bacterium]